MADASHATPLCVLLLTRPLESFILRDQAADLVRADGVVAVEPPRVPYGAIARLPGLLADRVAAGQARRLRRSLAARGVPRVVVVFHPLQYPLARALLAGVPDGELWYSRWDRYEEAYDASPRLRTRIADLHVAAAQRSAYTFAVSDELVRLETESGRTAHLVASAADSFPALELAADEPSADAADHGPGDPATPSTPAPAHATDDRPSQPAPPADPAHAAAADPSALPVVAVSLGHLGWRTDWALLRAVLDAMPELTLLLVGEWHDEECGEDPDYQACRAAPGAQWLGRLPDEEAAQVIRRADVGILPFARTPFNDAGLPNRILKYARQGRHTVAPPLAGTRTWARAVTFADGPAAWATALRGFAGARDAPDQELLAWALAQTARAQNDPLWERLRDLGVDVRV